jgi:hypothetical protein
MEQRDKILPIAFAGPGVVNATIREDEVYAYQLQVSGGVGTPGLSLTGADAALFTLVGTTLQLDARTLPKHIVGGDNTYHVTVVASDGRTSAQQAFVIVVNPVDTDGDGLEDAKEVDLGTDPNNPDTDGDGLGDGKELEHNTDPNNPDTDGDGLEDGKEVDLGTDPNNPDTDGDGIGDGQEVTDGTDPLDPNDPNPGAGNTPTAVQVMAGSVPLDGAPTVGSTLSALVTCSGDGTCPVLKYQWEIETAPGSGTYEPIAGATTSTYVVRNTDQKRRIRVAVEK